jgi:hypothetical protein
LSTLLIFTNKNGWKLVENSFITQRIEIAAKYLATPIVASAG